VGRRSPGNCSKERSYGLVQERGKKIQDTRRREDVSRRPGYIMGVDYGRKMGTEIRRRRTQTFVFRVFTLKEN